MDVATLGIDVDSGPAANASKDLYRLTNAAKVAENAARGLATTTGRMNASKIAEMAMQMGQVERTSNAAARALSAESLAAQKAAAALNVHAIAANQNIPGMVKMYNVSNLAAQGFDVVTTAAGGMQAGLIGMQQGLQIAQVAMTSTEGFAKTLGAAFVAMLSPVTILAVGLTTLAAVGIQSVNWSKTAAAAIEFLADSLDTVAPYAAAAAAGLALMYAPALIGGVASAAAGVWGLTKAVGALAVAIYGIVGLPMLVVAGFVALGAAAVAFRDDITRILGVDIVGAAKTGANYIINSFYAAYEDIRFVWNNFGNVMGAAITGAVNVIIAGVNLMVKKAAEGIDWLIERANKIPGVSISTIGDPGNLLDPWENDYAKNAEKALAGRNKAIAGIMNTDRLDGWGTAIGEGADYATSKLKELAKWVSTVDEKKKKKGGKTDAENYSDIVDGANRRIASLKAEQAALGMTESEALKLKYTTDLLNQAQQKGIALTAGQRAELSSLAGEMASIEIATKNAQEAMDFAKSTTAGFINDLRDGLKNGESFWSSFGKAALSVLDRITDKLLNDVMDAIFKVNSSGGTGGILGWLSGLFGGGANLSKYAGMTGLFADGGYTGNMAASAVAGVVHGGEYVFSKKATDRIGIGALEAMHEQAKGYRSGGYVANRVTGGYARGGYVPNVSAGIPAANNNGGGQGNTPTISSPITISIDATGADAAGLARVQQQLAQLQRDLPGTVVSTVRDAQKRRRL